MKQKIVRIPRGTVLPEPLELTLTDPASPLGLVAEQGAKGIVIVKLDGSIREHVLALEVEDQVELELTTFFLSRPASDVRVEQRVSVGAHAKLHVCNATMGGNVEHVLISHVAGAYSTSSIDWVFSGSGEDRLHLSVKNLFDAPEGRGEITVKGVAEGRAHCRCDGMIEISTNGSRTDTYLTETMLMLDATARCDAVPALEIKTNDVKASHSATVTKVSEEDLFYLMTRRIPRLEARQMFVEGFFSEMLHRFSSEDVRHLLLQAIEWDLSAS